MINTVNILNTITLKNEKSNVKQTLQKDKFALHFYRYLFNYSITELNHLSILTIEIPFLFAMPAT